MLMILLVFPIKDPGESRNGSSPSLISNVASEEICGR
jgi:hypothetical protein